MYIQNRNIKQRYVIKFFVKFRDFIKEIYDKSIKVFDYEVLPVRMLDELNLKRKTVRNISTEDWFMKKRTTEEHHGKAKIRDNDHSTGTAWNKLKLTQLCSIVY